MSSIFLGKNPITWLTRTIRSKGPLRVIKVLWHAVLDASWDLVHGTETLARIAPQNLETDSTNKGQATYYGATRARPLVKLLQHLDLPTSGGFVDFGSGKGRVVLIAAEYGFKKVVGIDFSEPLCQMARKNLETFRRSRTLQSEVVIVHSDVVLYPIQSDETTFFLYDPFSAEVLGQVLQNLRQSLAKHPRQIWVIYNSPRYHDVMERSGVFTESRDYEIGGNEFCVYGSGRMPGRT